MRSILNRLEKLERQIGDAAGHIVFMRGCADKAKNEAALCVHGVDPNRPNVIFTTYYETQDSDIADTEPVITTSTRLAW